VRKRPRCCALPVLQLAGSAGSAAACLAAGMHCARERCCAAARSFLAAEGVQLINMYI
jgi:hypothetical protein